jgi:hypothetical protein
MTIGAPWFVPLRRVGRSRVAAENESPVAVTSDSALTNTCVWPLMP